MLDVEGRKWEVFLLKATIFAAVSCAAPDEDADCGLH
jgi:hypothetical protein